MKSVYETLMAEAEILGRHIDTDWAYEHKERYDQLEAEIIERFYADEITSEQALELCDTAFYDYEADLFED